MTKSSKNEALIQIEATQAELVASIEAAKALAEQSERLVRHHRDRAVQAPPAEPSAPGPA